MAAIYARRIMQGLMTLEQVPEHWHRAVAMLLEEKQNE